MDPAQIGTWVAVALTLMVLSYVLSDNPFYKVAEHIFVGASAGWTFVLVYRNVLLGNLLFKLKDNPGDNFALAIPLVLGVLLLLRPIRSLAWLSNTTMALVVGGGAALALVGAAAGLLAPQILATILPIIPSTPDMAGWQSSLNNLTIVVGVICTFLYFHFTGKNLGRFGLPINLAAGLGKYVLMITFGALFASIALSRVSLLIGRLSFVLDLVMGKN